MRTATLSPSVSQPSSFAYSSSCGSTSSADLEPWGRHTAAGMQAYSGRTLKAPPKTWQKAFILEKLR